MNNTYGIAGKTAPGLHATRWVDANGKPIDKLDANAFKNRFIVLYCFQSWCPGCHSSGLPALQKMTNALKENDNIAFIAIQTVFEGFEENTYEKMLEVKEQYKLSIPFGHDAGADGHSTSDMMRAYKTGGTPWFIFIDQQNKVVFNDFHLNVDAAISFLKTIQ